MARFSKADSRRMYSWWWDSHISPKNSRWLEENLKDMDSKVKSMIKLIEEDADSFARRAEMYYKKRPELMKLVEEFYRAYRSLAERYDHATRAIRHAHLTMAEAFPNQVPSTVVDDSPRSSVSGIDSATSDVSTVAGEFMDESDSVARRKALAQFSFEEVEEKEESRHSRNLDADSEAVIVMKEAIAKLEAEKEAGLTKYQQSLDQLSQLETEMAKTKQDFIVLSDHAKKAEDEAVILNKKLSEAEAEKDLNLQNYQHSVEKISKLQQYAEELNDRAESAEVEAKSLKSEIEKLYFEKEAALNQYMKLLEKISNLENKLQFAEEDSRMSKERAEKAEAELELLRETINILTGEKEAAAEKHQQCLDKISGLEEKLIVEVTSRDEKLRAAEEQFCLLEKSNQSLNLELEALMLKMGTQSQELTEKQEEIVRLCASIQEERQRFVEAEAAFEALQHLHAKNQVELQAISSELQHRDQSLKILEDEVLGVKKEKKQLEDANVSFEYSVKELKNENAGLRENWQREISEKSALLQKLGILDRLLEKNSVLEAFLSDLHGELEAASSKIEKLEETLQSLLNEKSTVLEEKLTLAAKLKETNIYLEKISESNTVLENSLSDAYCQLEALTAKSKNLESSCQLLANEKNGLKIENDGLYSQLSNVWMKLEDLEEEKMLYIFKAEELRLSLEMEILVLRMMVQELKESNHSLSAENLKFQEDISLLLSRVRKTKEQGDREKIEANIVSLIAFEWLRQLMEMNEELREGELRKEALLSQIQGENYKLDAEKISLMNEIRVLEERNCVLFDKVLDLENLCMVFRIFSSKIVRDFQEMNAAFMGKLSFTEGRLEQSEIETLRLKDKLRKTEDELNYFISLNNQSNNENEALIGRLESSMISQLLYEQKWNELHEACLSYMDQNEDLRTELDAFAPDIDSLNDCVSSLENRTATQIKLQHPDNEMFEDARLANASEVERAFSLELRDIRVRLEAVVKAAHEKNDQMVQESVDLHSQLETSKKQLQLLQNEMQNWRLMRPKPQISEAGDSLLTKDIVLDQVSDRTNSRQTADENLIVEDQDKELKLNLFEKSYDANKEVNKMNISERLESDMEKLVNLQMRVGDLKRKLGVSVKRKRAIEYEAIKSKLEEADKAILKLLDHNGRLMKNTNKTCCFDMKSFSMFDVEDGIVRMKKARKVSEKIGSLQTEVQRLESVVAKLRDDEKVGRSMIYTERKVLLRDYLYGIGARTENPQSQTQFCACFQV